MYHFILTQISEWKSFKLVRKFESKWKAVFLVLSSQQSKLKRHNIIRT